MKTRSALVTAAALGAAIISTPAFAGAVSFADLDLATEAGQQQLERRIDTAAREACGIGAVETGTRMRSSEAQKCYRAAKTSASEQVAARIARGTARGG